MRLLLPEARYPDADARSRFAHDAAARLRNIPGVETAAAINVLPASNNNAGRSIEIEGVPNADPSNPPSADYRTATPELFSTLQIPIRAGRGFSDADRADTQPVVIVNEALARRHWPNADPIGKRMRTGTDAWMTVVGVCGDHIHNWFVGRYSPTLYRPFRQAPAGQMGLLLRTSRDPATVAAEARAAVRAIDSAQPVFELQAMRKTLLERTLGLHYVGAIMFAFGGLALLLAVIGVYGVMAFMVTQRTHEIGVRMALGATRRDVLRLTVGQTGTLSAIGVGIGVALSLLLGRLIEAGLLGVASSDARITAALAAILVAAALAAGYLPARRAASIDPTVALRGE
jgi:putative ABC transport system permease protein